MFGVVIFMYIYIYKIYSAAFFCFLEILQFQGVTHWRITRGKDMLKGLQVQKWRLMAMARYPMIIYLKPVDVVSLIWKHSERL